MGGGGLGEELSQRVSPGSLEKEKSGEGLLQNGGNRKQPILSPSPHRSLELPPLESCVHLWSPKTARVGGGPIRPANFYSRGQLPWAPVPLQAMKLNFLKHDLWGGGPSQMQKCWVRIAEAGLRPLGRVVRVNGRALAYKSQELTNRCGEGACKSTKVQFWA